MQLNFSLIVPVYNESGNIRSLIKGLEKLWRQHSFREAILVENGSQDDSRMRIREQVRNLNWLKVIELDQNRGYGGGILAGFKAADPLSTHLGWIPADGQYDFDEVSKLFEAAKSSPEAFHKGIRKVRHDGKKSKFVSMVYSRLARLIIGLPVKDVNGLPKIFPKKLLDRLDFPVSSNFFIDCQLLFAAHCVGMQIKEHPVTFLARRSGVSSWSSARTRIYRSTFFELWSLRKYR